MIDTSHVHRSAPSISVATALAILLLVASACDGDEPAGRPAQPEGDQREVFDELSKVNFGALATTFERLAASEYVVTTSIEERDTAGVIVARRLEVRHVHPSGHSTTSLTEPQDGTFSKGLLSSLFKLDSTRTGSETPVPELVPTSPVFVDPKKREHFAYSFQDSILAGEPIRLFQVQARQSEDSQPVRSAQIGVAAADAMILSFELVRRDHSIFYDEHSTITIALARTPSGDVAPSRKRFDVRVNLPMAAPRRFVIDDTYSVRGSAIQ